MHAGSKYKNIVYEILKLESEYHDIKVQKKKWRKNNAINNTSNSSESAKV